MTDLKKILSKFYYCSEQYFDEDGDEMSKLVIRSEIITLVNSFVQMRDVTAYQEGLSKLFIDFLLKEAEMSDEDWRISAEEKGLLDQCIAQKPMILASSYTEKDVLSAILTTQLPQYLADPESYQASVSSLLMKHQSGELLIFSMPHARSVQRNVEQFLSNCRKDLGWHKYRHIQMVEDTAVASLECHVKEFANFFSEWLSQSRCEIVWRDGFQPRDFFCELFVIFEHHLVVGTRTAELVSRAGVYMSGLTRLSTEVMLYDFQGDAAQLPSLDDMFSACFALMKCIVEDIKKRNAGGIRVSQAISRPQTRQKLLEDVDLQGDQAQLSTKRVANTESQRGFISQIFCCCFPPSPPKSDLERKLISPVGNRSK